MNDEFKVIFILEKKNFNVKLILELIKQAKHIDSKNSREKIDIYHEVAEACRSIGKFSLFFL